MWQGHCLVLQTKMTKISQIKGPVDIIININSSPKSNIRLCGTETGVIQESEYSKLFIRDIYMKYSILMAIYTLTISYALNSQTVCKSPPDGMTKRPNVGYPLSHWITTNFVVKCFIYVISYEANWISKSARVSTKVITTHLELSFTQSVVDNIM